MPAWITDLIPLAPWIAVLAVLVWVVVKVWAPVRKFMHLVDDLVGEPERAGVPARPGLMERVQSIEHEVTTNHGSSLKDAVKELSDSVTELHTSVDIVQTTIAAQGEWQQKHEKKSDAAFERIAKLEETK